MLKFAIRKLKFSSVAHELGRTVPIETCKDPDSVFFKMTQINGLDEALTAPEGSVIVSSPAKPSSYDLMEENFLKLNEKFNKLEVQLNNKHEKDIAELNKKIDILTADNIVLKSDNIVLNSDIIDLKADVAALKIAPSILRIVETVRSQERSLIELHFPLLFMELRPSDQRLSYMRKKFLNPEKNDEIFKFFENPIVRRLDKLVSSPDWMKLEMKRNSIAHEAIIGRDEIISTWENLCSQSITDEKGVKISINPHLGNEIAQICKVVNESIESKY